MSIIKKLIPNNIKQEGKYFLYDLLKLPYSRNGVHLEILKWLPSSKSDPISFIDIGASIGAFAEGIAKDYQIKKGVLIEPLAKHIPLLNKKFGDKNFDIIHAAVADVSGEMDFYINDEFDSVSSLLKIQNELDALSDLNIAEPVLSKTRTLTLDQIVNDAQLSMIDLIKIDVQGAEHLIIKGATETLKKTRLVYTEFSFQPLYTGSSTFFDLYNLFYTHGFMLVDISKGYASNRGELLQGDALFINKNLIT